MYNRGPFSYYLILVPEHMGKKKDHSYNCASFHSNLFEGKWMFLHFCLLNSVFSSSQRILVATNLFGRGMDIERVNIVFNYDMPEDTDTYLHRVARAGRFGTKGLAITFVSDEQDAKILNEVQDRFEVDITELPEEIDLSSYIEGR